MSVRSRLNRLLRQQGPPSTALRIDTFMQMQTILEKGEAATLEERAWLETAKAGFANASPDDPLLRRIAEMIEERLREPDYVPARDAIEREYARKSRELDEQLAKRENGLKLLKPETQP